eukprot:1290256-Rhodomonas_salina.2
MPLNRLALSTYRHTPCQYRPSHSKRVPGQYQDTLCEYRTSGPPALPATAPAICYLSTPRAICTYAVSGPRMAYAHTLSQCHDSIGRSRTA